MNYVDRVIQPGEEVVYRAPLHWVLYLPGLILAIIAVVVLAYGLTVDVQTQALLRETAFGVAVLSFLAALLLLAQAFVRRWTTEVAVTSKRVIYKTGLVRRITSELNVEKIETVIVEQGVWGRLLNFGTVIIRGTGGGMEPVPNIDDPLTFRSKLTAR